MGKGAGANQGGKKKKKVKPKRKKNAGAGKTSKRGPEKPVLGRPRKKMTVEFEKLKRS